MCLLSGQALVDREAVAGAAAGAAPCGYATL